MLYYKTQTCLSKIAWGQRAGAWQGNQLERQGSPSGRTEHRSYTTSLLPQRDLTRDESRTFNMFYKFKKKNNSACPKCGMEAHTLLRCGANFISQKRKKMTVPAQSPSLILNSGTPQPARAQK